MIEEFEAIIIGAGEAGTQVESMAAPAGKKIVIIYQDPYGGTCLNYGCVPSKFMIARAHVAHQVRTAARFHISANAPSVDLAAIVAEKNERNNEERSGLMKDATDADNVTVIKGKASFSGDHQISVNGRTLHADKIFLATGQRPVIPDIDGLEQVQYFTNENIMDLTDLPTHLVVLGGGYIGCELGQCYRRFGAEVTIVHSHDHLLNNEELEVSKVIEQAFRAEGIELLLGYKSSKIEATQPGFKLTVKNGAGDEQVVTGSHLLLATGRQSNADTLNLAAGGVETDDKGNIKVNDYLETNVPGIYAIGDANGQQPFTPVALEEGKIAYINAFGDKKVKMARDAIGHAVFTDPEIGSIGLTEQQAKQQGHDIAIQVTPFTSVAKASLIGETAGFIKYVVDRKSHRILGCHVVGADAANLAYDAIIVARTGGTIHDIAPTVALFPSLQGGMQWAAEQLLDQIAPKEIEGALVTAPTRHQRGVGE